MQRKELMRHFKKKKFVPLDLRPKLTRAMRRRLPPRYAAKLTLRQKKKLQHFPRRKYALKI
jgi:large subunit ribosomal protein L35e